MPSQWYAFNICDTQGFLNINNNYTAECVLRRVGIGRKNWLFAGHVDAAKSCAILTTLIASAQRHGVDPQAYLTSVLAHIASTPVAQLPNFLPEKFAGHPK